MIHLISPGKFSVIIKTIPCWLFLVFFIFPPQSYSREYGWHYYGPDEPSDDIASFFETSLVGQSLFDHDYFLEDDSNWIKNSHSRSMMQNWVGMGNVEEWQEYLFKYRGIKANRREVIDFFYEQGSEDFNDEDWINENPSFSTKEQAKNKKDGSQPKTIKDCVDLKEYVDFINNLNPVLVGISLANRPELITAYNWTHKRRAKLAPTPVISKQSLDSFKTTAENKAGDSTLDPFLRAKYGFQLVRMASIENSPADAIKYYEQYFGKSPIQSMVRYRALGYRAKAYIELNDTQNALTDYLNIIDQCPALRAREIQSTRKAFKRQDFLDLAQKIKNPHHLATLYYVLGVYDPRDYSADTLEKMVTYGNKEAQSEATLVRTVQSIESQDFTVGRFNLLGEAVPSYEELHQGERKRKDQVDTSNDSNPNKYDSWIQLCEKAANKKGTRQPALWSSAGAA